MGDVSYSRLLTGMTGSPDIFQAKMSELMVPLEFIRAYLDDLLCITKTSLDDHLDHLRLILSMFREAGLLVSDHDMEMVTDLLEEGGRVGEGEADLCRSSAVHNQEVILLSSKFCRCIINSWKLVLRQTCKWDSKTQNDMDEY
jgi:hypothetical protein